MADAQSSSTKSPIAPAPAKAAGLEHVNITVSDPDRTAALLSRLFGWRVRWTGASKSGGRSVHVGAEQWYVALYGPPALDADARDPGRLVGGLNHVGVLVDDLDAAEARVIAEGLAPFNHGDYEPGRRFYFLDPDGIEFEVVSYA
jgi:catechol 2,3-dioxygenase-like lactoylglutathione lyase family enzyme